MLDEISKLPAPVKTGVKPFRSKVLRELPMVNGLDATALLKV
jgi:hypothetical protein